MGDVCVCVCIGRRRLIGACEGGAVKDGVGHKVKKAIQKAFMM